MSIAHRHFAAGFARNGHTTRTPQTRDRGWGHAEESESGTLEREGSMTSYPWEGLYLEVDEPASSTATAVPQPSTQLGRFLTSLMYGE